MIDTNFLNEWKKHQRNFYFFKLFSNISDILFVITRVKLGDLRFCCCNSVTHVNCQSYIINKLIFSKSFKLLNFA
jgi:hypothetical protein